LLWVEQRSIDYALLHPLPFSKGRHTKHHGHLQGLYSTTMVFVGQQSSYCSAWQRLADWVNTDASLYHPYVPWPLCLGPFSSFLTTEDSSTWATKSLPSLVTDTLPQALGELFKDKTWCDFTLKVSGDEIHAHKYILATFLSDNISTQQSHCTNASQNTSTHLL
jgi:hypothetical protein